jgi:hypothetical protein
VDAGSASTFTTYTDYLQAGIAYLTGEAAQIVFLR